MRLLITIAGPQSSGKTTLFEALKKAYPSFYFLPETNMYSLGYKNHRGAAYITKELEIEIVEKDIEKLAAIVKTVKTAVVETGIFHLMYLEAIAGEKTAEKYLKRYQAVHKKFHPVIIFIDTKPAISWKRRKLIYEKRVADIIDPKEKNKAMEKYRATIFRLYPLWLNWYFRLPFEKYMIKNSYKEKTAFLKEAIKLFEKIISSTAF